MYVKRPTFSEEKQQLSPAEKRKLERRHLLYYLRIWDADNDRMLGHLADVSTDGFMLVSEEKIDNDKKFNIEMRLPSIAGETEAVAFAATSCWSTNDVNQMFYDTGFKFSDISEENVARIVSIIEEYGMGS